MPAPPEKFSMVWKKVFHSVEKSKKTFPWRGKNSPPFSTPWKIQTHHLFEPAHGGAGGWRGNSGGLGGNHTGTNHPESDDFRFARPRAHRPRHPRRAGRPARVPAPRAGFATRAPGRLPRPLRPRRPLPPHRAPAPRIGHSGGRRRKHPAGHRRQRRSGRALCQFPAVGHLYPPRLPPPPRPPRRQLLHRLAAGRSRPPRPSGNRAGHRRPAPTASTSGPCPAARPSPVWCSSAAIYSRPPACPPPPPIGRGPTSSPPAAPSPTPAAASTRWASRAASTNPISGCPSSGARAAKRWNSTPAQTAGAPYSIHPPPPKRWTFISSSPPSRGATPPDASAAAMPSKTPRNPRSNGGADNSA